MICEPDDAGCAGFHPFLKADTAEPYGSFLVYVVEPLGWYYVACHPGCLPEEYPATEGDPVDPVGPFETSQAAYRDACSC